MATILVAGIGAGIASAASTAGASALTLGLIAAATAAATVGAAYLDSKFIYPELFGTDNPRQEGITGIDVMTGQDGSPGHTSWGRMALVGGHVLFFENYDIIASQLSTKKGDGVTQTKRVADVGVGWTSNLMQQVDQILADQKVLWRRDPNNVIWSDYRADIYPVTYTTTDDTLRITPNVNDAQELLPIFTERNVVSLVGATPAAINGLYTVKHVGAPGEGGAPVGYVDLTPQEQQDPSLAIGAGNAADPMTIQRMDSTFMGTSIWGTQGATAGFFQIRDDFTVGVGTLTGPNTRHAAQIFRVGQVMRFENAGGIPQEGRYRVTGAVGTVVLSGHYIFRVSFEALDGQPLPTHPTNPTVTLGTQISTNNASRFVLDGVEGFLEPASGQEMVNYLGLETQGPDPDLLGVFGTGNVHGYRGLARSTVRNMNLTNWGDRVPQMSAVVKCNVRHTTHDVIRDLMREAFRGDDSRFDLTKLGANALLGYTRRGQQSTSTTLQPVAIAYGIESQERGRKWTFFKGADADLHQLRESDLGAHVGPYVGGRVSAFEHKRVQDRDLPRRLSYFYRDPLNNFTRTEKAQRSSVPSDPKNEEVVIDVDPVVQYPWEAQNRCDELFAQAVVARDQGTIKVPPSRIDILPNDRVTYTALNWNIERIDVSTGNIDHTTSIDDIEPRSVSIEVEFATSGRARLIDDGQGVLEGIPAAVTATVNSVDYDTGEIDLDTDEEIIAAVVRFEFPNPWRMRVQRMRRRVNGVVELDVVAVAEKFRVVGSPVEINTSQVPLPQPAVKLTSHYLDISGPWYWAVQNPGAMYVAAPKPGSDWTGAGVYTSTDGTSYTLRRLIGNPTTMGETINALPAGTMNVIDHEHEIVVHMAHGTFEDATLTEITSGLLKNWLLVGNEIMAFTKATLAPDPTVYGLDPLDTVYVLTGLLRGMRDTGDERASHVENERVVLLDLLGLDGVGTGTFEEFAMPGELGTTLSMKIVPAGVALDDIDPVDITLRGNNVRPFTPGPIIQGDIKTNGYDYAPANLTYAPEVWLVNDITVRWFRKQNGVRPVFGAGSAATTTGPERYIVEIYRNGTILPNRTRIIGTPHSGSPGVHRIFRYTLAEQQADGWVSTDVAEFRIREIGYGGQFGYSKPASITWTIP